MLISQAINFLSTVLLVSLAVSFFYTLLTKWGVWEYLQVHADCWLEAIIHKESNLLNRAFSCAFCLSWWLSVLICVFILIITGDFSFLLVPFCSTPLSRRLL